MLLLTYIGLFDLHDVKDITCNFMKIIIKKYFETFHQPTYSELLCHMYSVYFYSFFVTIFERDNSPAFFFSILTYRIVANSHMRDTSIV